MQKTLNILSLIVKLATVALGALTAGDTTILHVDPATLGKIVSGLGTAALAIKGLQVKLAPAGSGNK